MCQKQFTAYLYSFGNNLNSEIIPISAITRNSGTDIIQVFVWNLKTPKRTFWH